MVASNLLKAELSLSAVNFLIVSIALSLKESSDCQSSIDSLALCSLFLFFKVFRFISCFNSSSRASPAPRFPKTFQLVLAEQVTERGPPATLGALAGTAECRLAWERVISMEAISREERDLACGALSKKKTYEFISSMNVLARSQKIRAALYRAIKTLYLTLSYLSNLQKLGSSPLNRLRLPISGFPGLYFQKRCC